MKITKATAELDQYPEISVELLEGKIMCNEFDVSCYADHELDYWNAAMDHSGMDSGNESMTEAAAKEYCKANGITPYLRDSL